MPKANLELVAALEQLGYANVGKYVFKAIWSSDEVSHYIYLTPYSHIRGTPAGYMQIVYGFRNDQLEEFAFESWSKYGNEKIDGKVKRFQCSNRFFVLHDNDPARGFQLCTYDLDEAAIAAIVKNKVQSNVVPNAKKILDLKSMFIALSSDEWPFNWRNANGALRSAQIIALCHLFSCDRTYLDKVLTPHYNKIRGQLYGDRNVERFLDATIAAAAERFERLPGESMN